MKIKSRNIICILLIIVLVSSLVSGCLGKIGETIETAADLLGFFPRKSPDSNVTTISGNEDGYPQVIIPEGIHHNDIRFADMVYERPDIENLEARLNTLYEKVLSGDSNNPDQLFQEYQEVMELYDHADSMLSLAYVLYAFNVHEPFYNDEYQYLEEKLLLLDLTLTDLSIALFEMDEKTEQIARETYGESFIQTVYDGEHLNSEEIQEDLGIEEKLIHEYDKLASSYSIQYGDKDITVEELIADESIPIDIKQELYNRYFTEFNAEAGKIFLQLVEVRTRIARKLGYQSYADYQYENYGRDYSTDDARNLQNAVKKYIVPVYLKSILNEYLGEDDYTGFYSLKIEKDSFIDWFKNAAKDFSPLLMESLEYMLRNELYDFKVDENKMEGSFTTYFSDYETPYMFTQWTGDPTCPTTFIHETGHFTNYYWNAQVGWSRGTNLDLAEIDSQSLPLLMIPKFGTLYGRYADLAVKEALNDAMYAIISGCMEDEFQQAVYETPNMDLDEMNQIYLKICKDYGFEMLYGYTGVEWAAIPHSFQSPMYYISYATSMIPALEIWKLSTEDYEFAKSVYFSVLLRDNDLPFRRVLSKNGLKDIFIESTIKEIADALSDHLSLNASRR